jgi:hypothetical protein
MVAVGLDLFLRRHRVEEERKKQPHKRRSATLPRLIYAGDPLAAQHRRWSGFFGQEICTCRAGSGEAEAGGDRYGGRGAYR